MKIKCPFCNEDIGIKDDKKYIDCPYCLHEFKYENKTIEENKPSMNEKEKFEKLFKKK